MRPRFAAVIAADPSDWTHSIWPTSLGASELLRRQAQQALPAAGDLASEAVGLGQDVVGVEAGGGELGGEEVALGSAFAEPTAGRKRRHGHEPATGDGA